MDYKIVGVYFTVLFTGFLNANHLGTTNIQVNNQNQGSAVTNNAAPQTISNQIQPRQGGGAPDTRQGNPRLIAPDTSSRQGNPRLIGFLVPGRNGRTQLQLMPVPQTNRPDGSSTLGGTLPVSLRAILSAAQRAQIVPTRNNQQTVSTGNQRDGRQGPTIVVVQPPQVGRGRQQMQSQDGSLNQGTGAVQDNARSPWSGQSPDNLRTGQSPDNLRTGQSPDNSRTGQSPDNLWRGQSPDNSRTGQSPDNSITGQSPDNSRIGQSPEVPTSNPGSRILTSSTNGRAAPDLSRSDLIGLPTISGMHIIPAHPTGLGVPSHSEQPVLPGQHNSGILGIPEHSGSPQVQPFFPGQPLAPPSGQPAHFPGGEPPVLGQPRMIEQPTRLPSQNGHGQEPPSGPRVDMIGHSDIAGSLMPGNFNVLQPGGFRIPDPVGSPIGPSGQTPPGQTSPDILPISVLRPEFQFTGNFPQAASASVGEPSARRITVPIPFGSLQQCVRDPTMTWASEVRQMAQTTNMDCSCMCKADPNPIQPVTKLEDPLQLGSASSADQKANHTVLKSLIQEILQEMFAKQFISQGRNAGPLNAMPDATLVAQAVLALLQRNAEFTNGLGHRGATSLDLPPNPQPALLPPPAVSPSATFTGGQTAPEGAVDLPPPPAITFPLADKGAQPNPTTAAPVTSGPSTTAAQNVTQAPTTLAATTTPVVDTTTTPGGSFFPLDPPTGSLSIIPSSHLAGGIPVFNPVAALFPALAPNNMVDFAL